MVSLDIISNAEKAISQELRLKDVHVKCTLENKRDGTILIEGDVETIAEKRLVLEGAGAAAGVSGIVDRIRVRPAQTMKDRAIRQHFVQNLYDDPSFKNIDLKESTGGEEQLLRGAIEPAAGYITIECQDGIVTLNGEVPSLEHKRLAGVLAWWVPGSCDVINGIAVEPPEEDGPDRIEEAVRIALEKDPLVNADQIRVGVRNRIVRLTGKAVNAEQRHMAECDAWYVLGIDDVINEIEVFAS